MRDLQHLAVQKQQRGQCLILRRGRHAAGRGEVRQERFDLRASHSGSAMLPPIRMCLYWVNVPVATPADRLEESGGKE